MDILPPLGMNLVVGAAWILSGVSAWDDYENWYKKEYPAEANDLLIRDLGRLFIMLFGPVFFICKLLPNKK
jgi:hypothetical protein